MKTFWLTTVGAARFSVYLEPYRTNNNVESWHRSLNRKMIGKHLQIWKFIGKQFWLSNSYLDWHQQQRCKLCVLCVKMFTTVFTLVQPTQLSWQQKRNRKMIAGPAASNLTCHHPLPVSLRNRHSLIVRRPCRLEPHRPPSPPGEPPLPASFDSHL